eukprot:363250-Chlamydomonas_euryale.AAC.10
MPKSVSVTNSEHCFPAEADQHPRTRLSSTKMNVAIASAPNHSHAAHMLGGGGDLPSLKSPLPSTLEAFSRSSRPATTHLAQQHRDDGHDGERAKRPKEDKRLWLARREQQRDKEGLVADF